MTDGVSSDTIRARPEAKQSRRHILQAKNLKIQFIFTERNNKLIQLFLVQEKIEQCMQLVTVPALTVTSLVRCFLIIPDQERRALFVIQSPVWQSLGVHRLLSKLNLHFTLLYH